MPGPVNIARPAPLRFHIPTGGPATLTGPGTLSMKVKYLQEPLTHKASYAGTREFTQRQACLPATMVIARGLVQPPLRCGRCFPAMGQGVKGTLFQDFLYFFRIFCVFIFFCPRFD